MKFAQYVEDATFHSQLCEMVELPFMEDVGPQVQSFLDYSGAAVKKEVERLVFRTSQELQEWATQMQTFGQASPQQKPIIDKILANPKAAAEALIRRYVVTNVKA